MERITSPELKVLEALARYRYLTVNQLARLGIRKSPAKVGEKLIRPLRKKGLIESKHYKPDFRSRAPSIHFLKRNAVIALAEIHEVDPDSFVYPKYGLRSDYEYHHRVGLVDFHISLRMWAEREGHKVRLFEYDFDLERGKVGYEKKTGVTLGKRRIIPDINFLLDMSDGESRLFTVELHNLSKRARVVDQLLDHVAICKAGLLSKKYGHDHGNRVLSVYTDPRMLESVRDVLRESPEFMPLGEAGVFLFNSLEVLSEEFSNGWSTIDEGPSPLFAGSSPSPSKKTRKLFGMFGRK